MSALPTRIFSSGNFAGRVAFITGAASGIGLGLARVLARRGARLALADVRTVALDRAVADLIACGAEAVALPVDVTDRAAMERTASTVIDRFGSIHLVVNNAGVAQVGTPLDEVDEATLRWMFEVNVHGVANGMASFAPLLKANGSGGGHIVNTASIAGLYMVPGWHMGIYSASKMAVIPLTLAMRLTLEPHNIGVSAICPGRIWSELRGNSAALAPGGGPQVSNLPNGIDDDVMSPEHAGELILKGVAANRPLILTHPELADDVAAYHSLIMDEFTWWSGNVETPSPASNPQE